MPNVELVRAIFIIHILPCVKVSILLTYYFFELLCTHTDRRTQRDRHTDGHEYSKVAVYQPQKWKSTYVSIAG